VKDLSSEKEVNLNYAIQQYLGALKLYKGQGVLAQGTCCMRCDMCPGLGVGVWILSVTLSIMFPVWQKPRMPPTARL
jgi:hypothetical protein